MGWFRLAVLVGLIGSLGVAGGKPRGLCNYETGPGGLAKASCRFPSCPAGVDCEPPAIDPSSALIQYDEPIIQWKPVCPDTSITGACWEVRIKFQFQMAAQDESGVEAVGVHLATEVMTHRSFKYYWNDAQGERGPRYEVKSEIRAHVPPGQRLDLGVYELCARDRQGSEGCVLPKNGAGLDFSVN